MLKDKKRIILAIIIVIILIGLVITATIGLEYDLEYSKNQKLSIYMENEFNVDDIKQISKEVFGNQKTYVQIGALNEKIVNITAKTISEEQTDEVINKINEKYEIEINKDEDTQLVKNAKMRGRDIVLPYIYNVTIAVVVFLIYVLIRYIKIGIIKVTSSIIGALILTQALYLSILSIVRTPVNRLTMPIALSILAITMIICIIKLDKVENSIKKSQKSQ